MADDKQDRFFDLLDKIIDKAFKHETRLQKLEFKTTIMWWVSGSLLGICTALLVYYLQKQI